MSNVFTARASWEAICDMPKNLAHPPFGANIDPYDFRQDLCYIRVFDEVQEERFTGEAEHVIDVADYAWKGFPYGVDGIWWNCSLGALLDLCLQKDGSYSIRFIGADDGNSESFDLYSFLRAVDLDTLKVEQVDWNRLAKLVHGPMTTVNEALMVKHLGEEIADTLLGFARKDVREKAMD